MECQTKQIARGNKSLQNNNTVTMDTGSNVHQTNQNDGQPSNIIPQPNVMSPTRRCRTIKEKELEDSVELMKDREKNSGRTEKIECNDK